MKMNVITAFFFAMHQQQQQLSFILLGGVGGYMNKTRASFNYPDDLQSSSHMSSGSYSSEFCGYIS